MIVGPRATALAATLWALPYVASKVAYAIDGRLGVHGGPRVTAEDYASYDRGEVAAAQWSNAAVGVLLMLVTALPLLPVAQGWNRWVLSVPLALVGATLVGAGGVFVVGQLADESGGVFGGYTLAWGALVWLVAADTWKRAAR